MSARLWVIEARWSVGCTTVKVTEFEVVPNFIFFGSFNYVELSDLQTDLRTYGITRLLIHWCVLIEGLSRATGTTKFSTLAMAIPTTAVHEGFIPHVPAAPMQDFPWVIQATVTVLAQFRYGDSDHTTSRKIMRSGSPQYDSIIP